MICSGAHVVLKRGDGTFPETPCLGQEVTEKFSVFSFFFLSPRRQENKFSEYWMKVVELCV
jgi:hypothetical protein